MDTSVLGIYCAQLEALATHLQGHRFVVDSVTGGLVVRTRGMGAMVVVTCRPYGPDSGRLWFFAELDRPLAEADPARMMDVVVAIKGRFAES